MEITVTTKPNDFEVRHLALDMREADKREVFHSSGEDPVTALQTSIDASDAVWMFFGDGVPLCISGVAPITQTIGAPWLLCSNSILKVEPRIFMKCSVELMKTYEEHYHVLMNYVDVENVIAKEWLQRLGFVERETVPYGYSQKPFTRFEYTRKDDV